MKESRSACVTSVGSFGLPGMIIPFSLLRSMMADQSDLPSCTVKIAANIFCPSLRVKTPRAMKDCRNARLPSL